MDDNATRILKRVQAELEQKEKDREAGYYKSIIVRATAELDEALYELKRLGVSMKPIVFEQ